MSLLPRIPCRKFFIDSRFALPGGTSTEFEVEIPQGGLDLPDNCVGFVDAISVPSFPNIFLGKHRVYYRQATGDLIEFLSEELTSKQYTLAGLVFALNNTLTFPGLTNSLSVSPHTSAGTITYTMTGAASEEVRILTDDELRLLQVENNWDISGTDWVYPRLISDGAWTTSRKVLNDGKPMESKKAYDSPCMRADLL